MDSTGSGTMRMVMTSVGPRPICCDTQTQIPSGRTATTTSTQPGGDSASLTEMPADAQPSHIPRSEYGREYLEWLRYQLEELKRSGRPNMTFEEVKNRVDCVFEEIASRYANS